MSRESWLYIVWAGALVIVVLMTIRSRRQVEFDPTRPAFDITDDTVWIREWRNRGARPLRRRGSITAVAFVTERCPVCRREAGAIAGLLAAIPVSDRLLVSLGYQDDATHRFFRPHTDTTITHGTFLDEEETSDVRVERVPSVAIFDERRNLRLLFEGAHPDTAVTRVVRETFSLPAGAR